MGKNVEPTSQEVYDRNTRRAERVAWLIVVGLGVELFSLAFAGRPLSEIIPQAIADILIAGGVAFELYFERRARIAGDAVQAEAKKSVAEAEDRAAKALERAAEANQKAQEASLELAELTAPRGLTPEQRGRIVDKLKPFSGTEYDISISDSDPNGT